METTLQYHSYKRTSLCIFGSYCQPKPVNKSLSLWAINKWTLWPLDVQKKTWTLGTGDSMRFWAIFPLCPLCFIWDEPHFFKPPPETGPRNAPGTSRQAMIFIMGSCLTERSTPSEAALLWKGERQKGPAVELQISNAESSRFDKASCHSEDEPLDGCWRRDEGV